MSSESVVAPPAIVLEDVVKRYRRDRGAAYSLRGLIFGGRRGRDERLFTALDGISLSIPHGATVGLIGGNGAGKSTLLRVAAGVSPPSSGRVTIPADTQSVLGLGNNFDGTLTGRENAETALIVNGFTRREARATLAAVQDFSELADFFESPVRTYSAGMTLRLAFGVTAQIRAGAFLVDEVLSVGDVRFQNKCVEHLESLKAEGATIVMASHDLGQVETLCDEVVWMHTGRIRMAGPADEVVAAYTDAMRSRTADVTPAPPPGEADGTGRLELRRNRLGSQEMRLAAVSLNGAIDARIAPGGALRMQARIEVAGAARRVIAGLTIRRASDSAEVVNEHMELGVVETDQDMGLEIDRLDLAPGAYLVDVGVYEDDWSVALDYHWGAHRLDVTGAPAPSRLLAPPARWTAHPVAEGQERV